MIIPDGKHKLATVLMARMKDGISSGATPMKPENDMDDKNAPYMSAAEDLIAAFHEKSAMGLVEALKNFLEIHDGHEESESPEFEEKEHQ
jgi:hypothetical protein